MIYDVEVCDLSVRRASTLTARTNGLPCDGVTVAEHPVPLRRTEVLSDASSLAAKTEPKDPETVVPVRVWSGSVESKVIDASLVESAVDFRWSSLLAKNFRSIASASYSLVLRIELTAMVWVCSDPAVTET